MFGCMMMYICLFIYVYIVLEIVGLQAIDLLDAKATHSG